MVSSQTSSLPVKLAQGPRLFTTNILLPMDPPSVISSENAEYDFSDVFGSSPVETSTDLYFVGPDNPADLVESNEEVYNDPDVIIKRSHSLVGPSSLVSCSLGLSKLTLNKAIGSSELEDCTTEEKEINLEQFSDEEFDNAVTEDEGVGLDDFEILKLVGQGAFGKVFQVRKKGTSEIYAMKVMRKDKILEKNHSAYMKAERDILTKIDHPFIVQLRYSFQAIENEGAASPKSAASAPKLDSSVTEQNGVAGRKSKVDPSIHTQVSESATASGYWKDFVVGEQVAPKVDTSGDAEVASSSDDSENKGSSPLAGPNVMNVIVVASECAPFCKTGGLGDVVGALPKALARRGHRVMVVIPKYGDYAEARDLGVRKRYKVAGQDSEVTYFHSYIDGVDFLFLEAPPFRHRHNDIYGGERPDVLKRMILFCKAAVEVPWYAPCGGTVYGDGNLVFIANDWHTALLPVYLKAYYRDNGLMQYTRSVLVIHNIAHQGRGPVEDFFNMDLPEHYIDHFKLYDPAGGEHSNVFAAGLKMADRVVTVSHGYLWELKTIAGGWGLHEVINQNEWKLDGIVNGIDTAEWNPKVDVHLHSDDYTNYTFETLDTGKRQCKEALQRQLGLQVRSDVPVIGFIGRLDRQKGVDLIAEAMPWITQQDVQVVMLGTGRPDLEETLRRLEGEHRDKVRGWVGFSVQMAHRITAGADVLLMPSLFEPCGLNQLYAMAYGTVPVVHAVGGLRDTVAPFDPYGDTGLGWTFDRADAGRMIDALGHCLNTYWNYKESWRGLQARGMSQDLSWDHAAELYENVLVKAKYQW